MLSKVQRYTQQGKIGVLVAVSIPIFTSQLKKARFATNEANIRSSYAAAVSAYLTDEKTGTFYYSVGSGQYSSTSATSSKTGVDVVYDVIIVDISVGADGNAVIETTPHVTSTSAAKNEVETGKGTNIFTTGGSSSSTSGSQG